MAGLIVDVHPFKAKLTLISDGTCFLIPSTVSAYSLQQMSLRVAVDGSTRSSRNALYDCRSFRFNIAFPGILAEQNSNMRLRFHMSWVNSEVSMSFAAILERFVCHFIQYGLIWMSNIM